MDTEINGGRTAGNLGTSAWQFFQRVTASWARAWLNRMHMAPQTYVIDRVPATTAVTPSFLTTFSFQKYLVSFEFEWISNLFHLD
jgi:hypothetical protein